MIGPVTKANFAGRYKNMLEVVYRKSQGQKLAIRPLLEGGGYLWKTNISLWQTLSLEHGNHTISKELTEKLLSSNISKVEFKNPSREEVANFFSLVYFENKIKKSDGIAAYGKITETEPAKPAGIESVINQITEITTLEGKAKFFLENGSLTLNGVRLDYTAHPDLRRIAEALEKACIEKVFFRDSAQIGEFFDQLLKGVEFIDLPGTHFNFNHPAWLEKFLATKPILTERIYKLINREITGIFKGGLILTGVQKGYETFVAEKDFSKQLAYLIFAFCLYCQKAGSPGVITKSWLGEIFAVPDIDVYLEILKNEGFLKNFDGEIEFGAFRNRNLKESEFKLQSFMESLLEKCRGR